MQIMKQHILHVVGGMNRGGIETWLMNILRHIDRDRFQMDFLVHTDQPCAYDDEILALGSQIIPCLNPSNPWLYAANFRQILHKHGHYDIIHSHVYHFSGYVLHLAQQAGIPNRIFHSHCSSALEANQGIYRQLYLRLTKYLIKYHSTIGLGCSEVVNADFFGQNWQNDLRWQILYCGINLTPFQQSINRFEIRNELNIPADAFVIGHVGRIEKEKNHQFLLKIFATIASQEQQAYLLIVGEGSLISEIKQQARDIGIADRVIFAGSRPDVARIMRGAMDVFVFPSFTEGLPLVLIEAQAAGLPCILSDAIPEEADIVKQLVKRLSLHQPVSEWVHEILSQQSKLSHNMQPDSLGLVKTSPFNIETSVQQLEKIYQTQFTKAIS
ncbi:glycosyltransferase family 1 protein [Anabaena sp. UHCC 0253]|nr:glycosyltransferase family 1 protein [Anabaena sp. UHCC 0204]MTJ55108.1 glycosyltransferase family 1 protein [Anabaena sp. UHCC 0253]